MKLFGQVLTAVILKQCFGSDQKYDFISFWVSTRSHMTLFDRYGGGVGAREQALSAAFPVELRPQKEMTKESHLPKVLGVW